MADSLSRPHASNVFENVNVCPMNDEGLQPLAGPVGGGTGPLAGGFRVEVDGTKHDAVIRVSRGRLRAGGVSCRLAYCLGREKIKQ